MEIYVYVFIQVFMDFSYLFIQIANKLKVVQL